MGNNYSRIWNTQGDRLKTFEVDPIEQSQGVWSPRRIVATNDASGHRTILRFESTVYDEDLPDDLFTVRALEREVRR